MKRRILIFQLILVLIFSSLSFTPGMMVRISAAGTEITAGDVNTLTDALNAAEDGDVIKLTAAIDYNQGITISGKNIIFDLNGFDLNVNNEEVTETGLEVTNGGIDLTGSGEFNVAGSVGGVYADNAAVTVTNAASSGGTAAYADNGGEITVNGNAEGYAMGAYAVGAGSTVSVSGDATADGVGSRGAEASNGGNIIIGGNVQGGYAGAYAHDTDSIVTVDGNATANGVSGMGDYENSSFATYSDGGEIVIGGNASATGNGMANIAARAENGGSITIDGDAQGKNVGVYANGAGSTIEIKSNVMATKEYEGIGALAQTGGEITIDGTIAAEIYIEVNQIKDGSPGSRTVPTTKPGYFTYTDGVNTVWVMDNTSYTAEIDGILYATLDEALAAVDDGQTIKLLDDITDSDGISITNGKAFTIDLDGHILNVTNSGDLAKGLEVTNGSAVDLDDSVAGGAFNVSGSSYGVYADDATIIVSSAMASEGTAVVALNGADITVNGNAGGTSGGVFANNSSVTVKGDAESTDDGTVAVNSQGSTVHVYGSAIAHGGSSSHGVLGSGNVTIDGNAEGSQYGVAFSGDFSIVNIEGNVIARGTDDEGTGFYCFGASASGGNINIGGNVIAADGTGVHGAGSGKVTIDGTVTAATYIKFSFGGVTTIKTIEDKTLPTTLSGYDTYSSDFSTVWIKETASPVAEIDGTQYITLDDALNAVPTGGATATTIKILQDINYIGGITVSNKKITFDLDGKTLAVNNAAGRGLYITGGSVIDITNPGAFNVTGSTAGLYATNSTAKVTNVSSDTSHGVIANNSDVTVTNDITSNSYMGAAASAGSKVSAGGNVSGAYYGVYAQDAGTAITVTGNVTAAGNNSCGAHSRGGAAVTIHGNVTTTGSNNKGADLNTGGTLTVDGSITAQTYIILGTAEKTAADITTPTTKAGYYTYTDGTSIVWVKAAEAYVAEVDGIQYVTLDEALAAVGPGETDTIKLLADMNYDEGINIAGGQNITFDLNGYTLNVTNGSGIGLEVTNGHVGYIGSGAFNAAGTTCGASANGGSAAVTITNATATTEGGNGAVAINGGDIVVNGNAQGGYNGVSVANIGSTAVINGNATGTASDGSGARAGGGASVTINGGNAQGVMYGVYSNGSDSHITINGGDAIGTGPYSHGAHAEIDGKIDVNGNVQGTQYGVVSGDDTYVKVTGNVTVTATVNGWGVNAESGGTVEVGGNVVANGSSLGAFVTSGGEITIDGAILASNYIRIFDDINEVPAYKDGSAGSRTIPTTKPGYYTYSAGTSSVWVKEAAADISAPTWPGSSSLTASNVGQTSLILTWPSAADNIGVTGYKVLKGGMLYTTVGNILTASVTGLTAGTQYTFKVEACDAAGNWSSTGPSITVTTTAAPVIPAQPIISPSGGTFTDRATVTITGSGGTVYYTIDGTNPTTSSIQYTSPFILSQSATVKAAVRSSSNEWSGVASAIFTIIVSSGGNSGGSDRGDRSDPEPKLAAQVLDSNGNVSKTADIKLDRSTGIAVVDIDAASLAAAFDKSKTDGEGVKTIIVNIPETAGAKAYEAALPTSFLTSADAMKAVEIKTGIATATVPGNMLQAANAAVVQSVSLTIAAADKSKLPAEVQAQIGGRPVIELSLKIDGKPAYWSNESAPVTVSIPYTPTAEELKDPEHITVWYIDGSGNTVSVPSGRYDASAGKVTFSTTHFSRFAVTFMQKTFNDLGGAVWANKQIEILASKGILRGITEKEFAPSTSITRADFLYYLVRTMGLDARVEGNFEDIKSDAYYYKEIGIAKKLGITSGTGNNKFNPYASITRQDMMVLTERALRMNKKLKQQGTASDLEKFSDRSLIAAYAANGVATIVKEALMVGSGDNINPLSNTTRAEAAVFLYRIYNKY